MMNNCEYALKDGKQITLRLEREEDYHEVEVLTRAAFLNWRGVDFDYENYLAHTLRGAPEFLPELDFVAVHDGRLIGNVMYSKAHVLYPDGTQYPVINFGPLSVLPEFQKLGVGSALMRHSLKAAARMGHNAVIFFGHPEYYPRFGFKEAKEFGITTARGENYPAFMAMELLYGAFDGVTGSFHDSPLFYFDREKAKEYDKKFQAGANQLIH